VSEEDAGSPCRQAKGSPRSTEAVTASTHIYRTDARKATSRTGAAPDAAAVYTARRRRINLAGLLVYLFVVASILYLAAHVGAALVGWRLTAFAAVAILWVVICSWSVADALARTRGRR